MDPSKIPPPQNNFHDFPTWNYPTLYDRYCTNGVTVPGESNVITGVIYIAEFLFFLSLYIPSLIVMSRPKLFQHACYKLMFAIGIIENYVGFMNTFMAGVFSIMGANYCDNNWLLIINGHITHVAWGLYSISVVTLALNRCIEIHSIDLADRLFGGRKAYLWMIPPWIYSLIMFSSTIDMPPIYNTVWSVYMFRIDFRDGAPPAMLQSFLICFFLFLASSLYAVAGFIQLPNHMLKFATISVQICSGSTSIVYLVINQEIRKGVTRMILGDNSVVSSVANSTMAISTKSSPDLKRYA